MTRAARSMAAVALVAALVAALGTLPGCGEKSAGDLRPAAREDLAPAERGSLRARGDIAAGKLRVYRYGNPASFTNPRTDPESGLPARTLLDCCITAVAREETEAYNRVMRETAATRRSASP
jgi:hypothetical protein